MKLMMKRFLLALFVVLLVATVGWCIDPYKVNEGGFGPKIKGLQLGMKLNKAEVNFIDATLVSNPEAYGADSIYINDEKRITKLRFTQENFGAKGMDPKEFVQEFMNAYGIQRMEGTVLGWEHSNLSEGWKISCMRYDGHITVEAIITTPKFD